MMPRRCFPRSPAKPCWAGQFELRYGEKRYPLTAQDVSLAVDAEATLDPLWQVGRSGNMIERYLNLLMARNTPVDAQLVLTYDMEAVDALLEQVRGDVERDPVDATITFLPGNSEPFRFTAESQGYVLDTAPLRSRIEDALRGLTSGQLDIEPEVIEPEIYQAELESATTLRARVTMQLEADEAAAANAAVAAAKLNGLRVEAGKRSHLMKWWAPARRRRVTLSRRNPHTGPMCLVWAAVCARSPRRSTRRRF